MKIQIKSIEDAQIHINEIKINIKRCISKMKESEDSAMELFYKLKFEKFGNHPLEKRNLNLIEQLNQSWTYLVSFYAVILLFEKHKNIKYWNLNLGTTKGFDIISEDDKIIAEVFASTSVNSNKKLNKDLQRLENNNKATHKYIFYHTPIQKEIETIDKISIIRIDVPLSQLDL